MMRAKGMVVGRVGRYEEWDRVPASWSLAVLRSIGSQITIDTPDCSPIYQ